jgi:hypothetical protein
MNKRNVVMAVVACGMVAAGLLVQEGCAINPCGSGQQECPDGTCAPDGNVCCGGGVSCPGGTTCGPNDTCLSGPVNSDEQACESCLSSGQQCCLNDDTTVDCTEVGRVCCGNHTSCPGGTVCYTNGTCS